jgi:hypothetical protein
LGLEQHPRGGWVNYDPTTEHRFSAYYSHEGGLDLRPEIRLPSVITGALVLPSRRSREITTPHPGF